MWSMKTQRSSCICNRQGKEAGTGRHGCDAQGLHTALIKVEDCYCTTTKIPFRRIWRELNTTEVGSSCLIANGEGEKVNDSRQSS